MTLKTPTKDPPLTIPTLAAVRSIAKGRIGPFGRGPGAVDHLGCRDVRSIAAPPGASLVLHAEGPAHAAGRGARDRACRSSDCPRRQLRRESQRRERRPRGGVL